MRILLVTNFNTDDIKKWSGTPYFIKQALVKSYADVDVFHLKEGIARKYANLKAKLINKFLDKSYLPDFDPSVQKYYAHQIKEQIKGRNYDLIFSIGAAPIAYFRTGSTIIYWTDAIVNGLYDSYPYYTGLTRQARINGFKMDASALNNATFAVFASDWAMQLAISVHNADPDKLRVIPFGANIDAPAHDLDVGELVRAKRSETCRLLFIGVEWERKGSAKVLQIARKLNARGLKTELAIVGCTPVIANQEEWIKPVGFINKNKPEGRERFRQLMTSAHFFTMLPEAECYGCVYAEASAHALPSIAHKVGGIPTVVSDHISGRLFDPTASPDDIADYIYSTYHDTPAYERLAFNCYEEYKNRLNWETSIQEVLALANRGVNRQARKSSD